MKTRGEENGRIPVNIVLLGLVSMFIDMSTEMVSPILPMFLVALGTTPAVIGIIEGITEGLATVLKVFAGYISDKTHKKKWLAVLGYSSAFFYKIGIIFSSTWVGVLIAKIVDRTGKGLRTAPRDSIIAESGDYGLGRKFGLHKMFDKMGSALGVLLAYLILIGNAPYKTVFYWSMLPAVLGVLILGFVKEKRKNPLDDVHFVETTPIYTPAAKTEKIRLKDMHAGLKVWLYLAFLFIFSIGNSSNAFLLLKAQNTGINSSNVLLFYLIFNLVASLFAIPCGRLSDKIGRRNMIVIAYIIYAAVYLCFGLFSNTVTIGIMFALYGFYQAFVTGAERALIVEISPKKFKGTVLGLQGMAQGLGVFLSSIIAGVLWEFVDISVPFFFGAGLALIAAVAMFFILRMPNKVSE